MKLEISILVAFSDIFRLNNVTSSLAAKSKNVTFDGKICYKLPSMLNHIFIRWAIWYGWMAGFLFSFKVFLGQKMQKMN